MIKSKRTKLLDRTYNTRDAQLFIIATEGKTEKPYFDTFQDSRIKVEVLATAYKYPIANQTELETEFKRLAKEWRIDTGMLSLVTQKSMHPAYQRIIGMGQPVVPLILRDLEQKPDHWFWALRAITGDNPVKPEQRGRMKQMAQAWIQWGKERGYEW